MKGGKKDKEQEQGKLANQKEKKKEKERKVAATAEHEQMPPIGEERRLRDKFPIRKATVHRSERRDNWHTYSQRLTLNTRQSQSL